MSRTDTESSIVKDSQSVMIVQVGYTLETHSRIFQKWACIFPIFHAVVLLAASN